jgi:chaperonin GroEL
MKNNKIIFDHEARQKLAEGADILAHAVTSTYGPRSYNVAINDFPAPYIVHDGVTVARPIKLKDAFLDMGAQLLKQAASKTNDEAGDGTTTATLLANVLIQEGVKLLQDGVKDGVFGEVINPMELRERILERSTEIAQELVKCAVPIKGQKKIKEVAYISAQDRQIGNMVAEAIGKVGSEGIIMYEDGTSPEDELVLQSGMEINNGYLSPLFVTDPHRMIAEYEDGYVLITDTVIADATKLAPIIDRVQKDGGKPLVVIADDIVGAAIQTMIATKLRNGMKLLAVKAPEYAERRKEVLEDLAVLLGAVVVTHDTHSLEDVTIGDLGRFKKFKSDAHRSEVLPKDIDQEDVDERVESIKEAMDKAPNQFVRERHRERLANLSQSVAVIHVGGGSKTEMDERTERFIDAINATRAAIAEGIIPGGGITLHNIAEKYIDSVDQVDQLIVKMLQAPRRKILENAGLDPDKIPAFGYDVRNRIEVDPVKAGIIDPVKVTRLAVQNAMSVAAMLLTTNTLIAEDEDANVQQIKE